MEHIATKGECACGRECGKGKGNRRDEACAVQRQPVRPASRCKGEARAEVQRGDKGEKRSQRNRHAFSAAVQTYQPTSLPRTMGP